MRGALTASTGDMSWSSTLTRVWRIEDTIFVPPGAPTHTRSLFLSNTMVGVIIVTLVLPGRTELGRPGRGSKQFM